VSRLVSLVPNVQFGGGLRTLEDIELALKVGVKRVVLGTVAVQQPEIVAQAVERFGADAVSVALDSIDGRVATHGWQTTSDTSPAALGKAMAAVGVRHALYTDVHRDGALSGVALEETIALGRDTGIQVVASGGISSLGDIWALAQSGHVAGAIIGMALYTGVLTLPEALNTAKLAEKKK
jgi:phosphoribosylformimino-5-aminoimidazole carboxamide ribotide isomerase